MWVGGLGQGLGGCGGVMSVCVVSLDYLVLMSARLEVIPLEICFYGPTPR